MGTKGSDSESTVKHRVIHWWPWRMNAPDSAGSLARTELCAALLPKRKLDVKQTQYWGCCASESPGAASGYRTNKVPADSFATEALTVMLTVPLSTSVPLRSPRLEHTTWDTLTVELFCHFPLRSTFMLPTVPFQVPRSYDFCLLKWTFGLPKSVMGLQAFNRATVSMGLDFLEMTRFI